MWDVWHNKKYEKRCDKNSSTKLNIKKHFNTTFMCDIWYNKKYEKTINQTKHIKHFNTTSMWNILRNKKYEKPQPYNNLLEPWPSYLLV